MDKIQSMNPQRFSVEDFRVPMHYLALIAGESASRELLASDDKCGGTDGCLPTITFVNLCLKHFRSKYSESWSNGPDVRFGTFCLIVSAAGQGRTFAEAIDRAVEAMDILRPELSAKISHGRMSLALSITPRSPSLAAEIGLEFLAMALHCAFRWLVGARLKPLHVRVAEAETGHEVTMLNILACRVIRRSNGVTIYYDVVDGARPLQPQKYDRWATQELPEFHSLLRESADEINRHMGIAENPLVAKVDDILASGHHSEVEVAARLNMSPASLRRHLAECDTSFRLRLDHLRRDAVEALLHTEKPLEVIATETGYSDIRSLRRACVRWFGTPPSFHRRAIHPATTLHERSA